MIVAIKSCAECPFFVQTTGAFLAGLLGLGRKQGESDPLIGECGCPRNSTGRLHMPMGSVGKEADEIRDAKMARMKIRDGHTLPERCPLQENGGVTVRLVD